MEESRGTERAPAEELRLQPLLQQRDLRTCVCWTAVSLGEWLWQEGPVDEEGGAPADPSCIPG